MDEADPTTILAIPIKKRPQDMTPEERKIKGEQLKIARQQKKERLAKEKALFMEDEIQRRVTERLVDIYETAQKPKKQTKKKQVQVEVSDPENEPQTIAVRKRVVAQQPQFEYDEPIEASYQPPVRQPQYYQATPPQYHPQYHQAPPPQQQPYNPGWST